MFDLRTVLVVVGCMGGLMAFVLGLMRRSYPSSIRGLGAWAAGFGVLFVSTLLFGARGAIPDVVSIVVANLLALGGFALLHFGTERSLGREPSVRLWGSLVLAAAPVLIWFTHVQPHFGVRTATVTLLGGSMFASHARLLLKHGARRFAVQFTTTALLIQATAQAIRFVFALSARADEGLFEPSPVQAAFFAVYVVCVLLISVGMVLMATERLAAELREQGNLLGDKAQELEELAALKAQLVADVAHELRTPVTLVQGPLEDLAEAMKPCPRPCGVAARRSVALMQRNTERLRDLVEQLLDTARLDTGGVRLRARRADLGAFLRRTAERFQEEATRRGLALLVAADTAAAWVYFDPDLIEKVLANLIANALKFTPSGGQIEVRLDPQPDLDAEDAPLDAFARVWVHDTGVGMTKDEAAHAFDRYYQTEGAHRRDGAGIGLALARGLVELHGGQAGVEVRPGEGTSFWFTLPLGAAHLRPDDIDLEAATGAAMDATGRAANGDCTDAEAPARPTVLVVEDHDDMRAYLSDHLASVGRVVAASNGRAALEMARTTHPSLIVSDVMMPEMDGLALCRAVRAEPGLSTTRLMLVTAKSDPAERLEGLSVADDHLSKPFASRELLARARNLLRRVEPASGPIASGPAVPAAPEPSESDRVFLEQLRAVVLAKLSDASLNVPALARSLGLSTRQLQRRCNETSGQPPLELVRRIRMEEAESFVRKRAFRTVAEVAAAVGMSPSYFSRLYTAWVGHVPSEDLRPAG